MKFHPNEMNAWFYPISPLINMGLNQICDKLWDICFCDDHHHVCLNEANKSLMDLYFHSSMTLSLQSCDEDEVREDPYNWTIEFLYNSQLQQYEEQ